MSRTTIGMVLAFAVLAVGVWAYQTTNPAKPEGTPNYVLEVSESDVQHLDVTTSAGTTGFERVEPFGWTFAGSGDPADFSRVNNVVNRLAKLRSNAKVLDTVPEPGLYGLSPPAVAAILTMKSGAAHRVLIGNKTVNDANYYAMVEAQGVLHTINTLIVGDVEKLVTEPPVPTPTPGATPRGTATPAPSEVSATPAPGQPTGTPSPTIGIPLPSAQ